MRAHTRQKNIETLKLECVRLSFADVNRLVLGFEKCAVFYVCKWSNKYHCAREHGHMTVPRWKEYHIGPWGPSSLRICWERWEQMMVNTRSLSEYRFKPMIIIVVTRAAWQQLVSMHRKIKAFGGYKHLARECHVHEHRPTWADVIRTIWKC